MAGQKIRIRLKAMTTRSSTWAKTSWTPFAHWREGRRSRCRCRRRRTCTASSARRTSTRTVASTSRCAPTKRLIDILDPTPKTVDSLMKLDLPAGVEIDIKGCRTPHEDENRKGLLGTKLGMTQVWDENNRIVPVTVVEAGPVW